MALLQQVVGMPARMGFNAERYSRLQPGELKPFSILFVEAVTAPPRTIPSLLFMKHYTELHPSAAL